jgi:integrase
MKAFLGRWLDDCVKPSVKEQTHDQYAQTVRLYLAADESIGRIPLTKLAPQDVQQLINAKLIAGLSPRTVQLALVVLRRALDQAVKWGLVARNVAKLVDPPKVKRPKARPFTPKEAACFLDVIKGYRLEAVCTLALLGLREGELLGLRWQDVDLEKRTVTIAQSLQRIGRKHHDGRKRKSALRFVEPKTDRSRRTLALPEFIAAALRAERARHAERRLAAGPEWRDFGLVFTTRLGTPIEPRNLYRDFKLLLARTDLPSIRFHDLRHSAATLLLARGVNMRAIMELLGHSRIGVTMDTYSHVMPEMMREVADTMDAFVSGGRKA